jgi:type VI secretion system secreted protein Hcp
MAFDCFLKLDGIPGESTDSKHKDEIEVLSFSWNIKQTIVNDGGGGGGAAGRAQLSDFSIVKHVDKASPVLMVAVCTGRHIQEGMFTVQESRGGRTAEAFKNGKASLEFLKIKFTDVLISSYQNGGGGTDQPMDQVSFHFDKVEISVLDGTGKWTQEGSCNVNQD